MKSDKLRGAPAVKAGAGPHCTERKCKFCVDPARSETRSKHGSLSYGNRETPEPTAEGWDRGARREPRGGTTAGKSCGESDNPIVPEKPANKGIGAPISAERVEGRGLAKGNPSGGHRGRTQDRGDLQTALERVRQAARKDKELRFTTLWHHVYNEGRLREAYRNINRTGAPGVDGETWEHYGENLEENLRELSGRLQRGAYRARPVRRVYIPKPDGRQRPIGVPTLEDKIVQRAAVEVLNAVYETDFLGFSYGFRPGRSQHDALDALTVGIKRRKVNWVLDADIRGFFDAIDHEWLVKFVEHRIADQRVVRHIRKWLKAGVLEDGAWRRTEEGTPQGGSILRQTVTKRMRAKLKELKDELRARLHHPVPETGIWLQAVLRGYYRYYGVPGNSCAMSSFRQQVVRLWYRSLRRRSQRRRLTWERMNRLIRCWLPYPRIMHPYPEQRLCV